MRIQHLAIQSYNNLKDFVFEPDISQPTTVVLGRNGAGKSNLIEALVEIFRDLESGKTSHFYYELNYHCRGRFIQIANDPQRKAGQQFIIDGKKTTKKAFRENLDRYLPKHVFAYYSGWNQRLEKLFDKPANELYRQWKAGSSSDNIPLRRLFFCRKDYSQLVLLAFFLLDDDFTVKQFLSDYLNIEDMESALFVMHRPYWRRGKKVTGNDRDEGDPKFWFAKGAFLNFLDRLWRYALAPIRAEESKHVGFRDHTEESEHVYLFIKNKSTLRELKYPGENETHFFAQLEGLYLCDLIDEVRVTVKHKKAGQVRFDQLSEGEQQLLTVLGLLHFTKDEESLFLLDEPDTHLNPAWTYEYLSLLEKQVASDDSQLLIASHNPLMIGSLRKEQVRLLRKVDQGDSFKVVAELPDEDPIGQGIDGLLQSEIFGLQSVLAPEIVAKINARQKLLAMHERTEQMTQELQKLSDELAELGVAISHPHPYFDQFAKALARKDMLKQPTLTPEEMAELQQITDQILEEIMNKDNK